MGLRRRSREAAFQLMYQLDVGGMSFDDVHDAFWLQMGIPHAAREFAEELTKGVFSNLERLDGLISDSSHNWKINRMSAVDKNILRLGVFELLFCKETPAKVIINEAIEIGKKFGTEESSSFINGILDKISKAVRKVNE